MDTKYDPEKLFQSKKWDMIDSNSNGDDVTTTYRLPKLKGTGRKKMQKPLSANIKKKISNKPICIKLQHSKAVMAMTSPLIRVDLT